MQYGVVAEVYKDIVMEPLPYELFGFTSAVEFVTKKMPDVARITCVTIDYSRTFSNIVTVDYIEDSSITF